MNIVMSVIIKNLLVNVFLVIAKISSGLIFHSTALFADGIQSLSDLITDFVSLFGEEFAKSKKGRKKVLFEDKTGLIVGAVIIILAISMIIHLFNSEKVDSSPIVISISIFVIVVKTIVVRYVSKMGKKLDNLLLISSAEESRADVITSVIALVAILLSQLSRYVEIFKYSDFIGGLIIGLTMLYVGFDIIIKNEKNIKNLSKSK